MKVTVTGSLGNISRLLIEKLVAAKHEVYVVSSDTAKAEAIRNLGGHPLIGSVEDYGFVKKAFEGSEAVYLMIPPNFHTPNLKQYIKTVGEQYVRAIAETGVRYAVNLSSIGAHLETGLGPTGANFYVEQQLNGLQDVHVLHLRPGMFFTNFYGAIPMIKYQQMLGNNFDGTVRLPLTHPRDIAEAAFQALHNRSVSGKQIQYIVSDEKNGFEIAQLLGQAVGKPDVQWIAFSDAQLLNALVENGFSEQMAKVYMVEIGVALREGSFMEHYNESSSLFVNGTSLQDFSKEFATAYAYHN
ncbi:NAD(P)H-binding protein [Niabella pedocola]|uniref:NAD(P)H-binding protein n=1 Tax=Niabella pedocola TaxID=1752077 RepID=A0ABS8PWW8_9BACT|nr:NAD(P)H-binding protein [Niabella pedocola]MCD2424772.1 NAD(P)H-binding protein [Niabella pedocola]